MSQYKGYNYAFSQLPNICQFWGKGLIYQAHLQYMMQYNYYSLSAQMLPSSASSQLFLVWLDAF